MNFEDPDGHKQVLLGNRLSLVGKSYDKNYWETVFLASLQGRGYQLGQALMAIALAAEAVVGLPVPWLLFTGAHLSCPPGSDQSPV